MQGFAHPCLVSETQFGAGIPASSQNALGTVAVCHDAIASDQFDYLEIWPTTCPVKALRTALVAHASLPECHSV